MKRAKEITRKLSGLQEILQAPPAERAAMILDRDDAEALVSRIPPEELLLTLRPAGRDVMVDLLSLARPAQLSFLMDLELWDKDLIRPERARYWLSLFDECDPARVALWLHSMETVDLAVLIGKVAKAELADEEGQPPSDPGEGFGSFSLDRFHYITTDEALVNVVRKMLLSIRQDDEKKYFHLLETLLTEFDSEDEEFALKFRNIRIAEHGFATFEEAQQLYLPLKPEQFEGTEPRREGAGSPFLEEGYVAPRYPLLLTPGGSTLLPEILNSFADTDQAEYIYSQLASLTNKVAVAEGLDLGEPKTFAQAAQKVAGCITIGLEALFGSDRERMTKAVDRYWLENLFRVGWYRILMMSAKAKEMVDDSWPNSKLERLLLLDSPLPQLLNAILRRKPKWLEAGVTGDKLRDFASLNEVELAERAVLKAEFLGRYLLTVVQFRLDDINQVHTNLADENLRGQTIFLTALVNAALGRGYHFAPIESDQLSTGLNCLWIKRDPPRKVAPRLVETAIEWSEHQLELSGLEKQFLVEFFSDSVKLLEDEFGHLPLTETPDPRFLSGIWIV